LNRTELEINFDTTWEEIFIVMSNLTNFINKRTKLIIDELNEKIKGDK